MTFDEKAYQEALDYLYSFVDYSLTKNLHFSPETFNLDRMKDLVEFLGHPELKYSVVHVAGTKGKGSTSAMIASVLEAAGYKVGLYTSPHLVDFAERIKVNSNNISHEKLVEIVEQLKPGIQKVVRLTTFELTTAAAFLYFSQENVDIAVIEVGLGGRLDSTNVVQPALSVITSLSMDHMSVLGDTLEKIAFEKAGIIKPGIPVVVSNQKPQAKHVIEQRAQELGSKVIFASEVYEGRIVSKTLNSQEFVIHPIGSELINPPTEFIYSIPLLGRHQVDNAVTAYAAIRELCSLGLAIPEAAIREGYKSVKWPCRFDIINKHPVIIVDSAHNRDSAEKLRRTVEDYFPGQPVILVFGASEDKDIRGMLEELAPVTDKLIFTQSIHPRAMDANKFMDLVKDLGIKQVEAIAPLEAGLDRAFEISSNRQIILVAGSLFVAAGAKDYYLNQKIN